MTTEPGPDLAATYLGLPLTSPLVGSASPLWWDLEAMRAAQDAGMGAIVLPSLYEEEIEREAHQLQRLLAQGSGAFVEAATYLPELEEYRTGPAPYLRHLELAATTLTVPVIGSLNGVTPGGWLEYSTMMAEAGAAAVELNPYLVAADPAVSAAEVEDRLVELVAQVVSEVGVPVAVKLSPWFSALANLAVRLVRAGAAGLVLFNRFVQPDVDLDRLTTVDDVRLSTPAELLLPLRWVALLRDRVDCSLALSGGVHSGDDAAKAVLVGADAVMATSVLLERGPDHVASLVAGLRSRLTAHDYTSVGQARGAMSAHNVAEPEAYERAWYHHALTHWPSGTSPERG